LVFRFTHTRPLAFAPAMSADDGGGAAGALGAAVFAAGTGVEAVLAAGVAAVAGAEVVAGLAGVDVVADLGAGVVVEAVLAAGVAVGSGAVIEGPFLAVAGVTVFAVVAVEVVAPFGDVVFDDFEVVLVVAPVADVVFFALVVVVVVEPVAGVVVEGVV